MAANSSMDAATLDKASNDCQEFQTYLTQEGNKIDGEKQAALAAWQSPAASMFGRAVDAYLEKLKRISNDVGRISELLTTTAKENVSQDEQQSDVFSRFGNLIGG